MGLAWVVSNEPFYPEALKNTLTSLKLRASVGKTGNDNTGSAQFLYRPTFAEGPAYYWGIGNAPSNSIGASLLEGRFESPFLTWEIERKTNYGVDMYFFNGNVDLQVDYFDNLRSNILLQRRTVSGVAGFRQSPWQNYGKVSNKGIDASLNVHQRFDKLLVSLRGNFTFARNQILEYDEIPKPYDWMQTTGKRLNAINGKIADGLYRESDFTTTLSPDGHIEYILKDGIPYYSAHPNPQPGDIKYKDLNGDGIVDDNYDIVIDAVNPHVPEIMYGFGVNLDYKGAYFNIFFQGADNVSLNLIGAGTGQRAFMPFYEGLQASSIRQEIIDSHWTKNNPSQNVLYPRLTHTGTRNTDTYSTWWFRDAGFIRLKNLELGYNLPKKTVSKINLNQARIYIMGQNIAVWDKVKLQDPELGSSGGGSQYPLPSTWSLGIELSL